MSTFNSPLLKSQDLFQGHEIIVGVADLKVSKEPEIITTYALGSCLGITLYDPSKKVGGMLHAMLPDSALHKGQAVKVPMFIDTGFDELVRSLKQLGANLQNAECKVFGGAQVMSADKFFNIGDRNVKAFHITQSKYGIRAAVLEVGGNVNRTIKFHLDSGKVSVRTPSQPLFWR